MYFLVPVHLDQHRPSEIFFSWIYSEPRLQNAKTCGDMIVKTHVQLLNNVAPYVGELGPEETSFLL